MATLPERVLVDFDKSLFSGHRIPADDVVARMRLRHLFRRAVTGLSYRHTASRAIASTARLCFSHAAARPTGLRLVKQITDRSR